MLNFVLIILVVIAWCEHTRGKYKISFLFVRYSIICKDMLWNFVYVTNDGFVILKICLGSNHQKLAQLPYSFKIDNFFHSFVEALRYWDQLILSLSDGEDSKMVECFGSVKCMPFYCYYACNNTFIELSFIFIA